MVGDKLVVVVPGQGRAGQGRTNTWLEVAVTIGRRSISEVSPQDSPNFAFARGFFLGRASKTIKEWTFPKFLEIYWQATKALI